MTRPRVALVALLLAVVLLAGCSKADSAAVVNGTTITNESVDQSLLLFRALAATQGQTCGQTDAEGPSPEDEPAACARQALGTMIQEEVLKQYAVEHDVVVDEALVSTTVQQLSETLTGEEDLATLLKGEGVTEQEFNGIIKRLLLFGAVQEDVTAQALGDEKIRKLYDENPEQFTMLDTSHVLVESEDEALEVREKATPKNFAHLAQTTSEDPGSATEGGSIGEVAAAGLAPEYAQAAIDAKIGSIVGPVETEFGWHVIWVKGRNVIPFEEARRQIIDGAPEATDAFDAWFEKAMTSAQIEVNPRYGRWDAEKVAIVPINSTDPSEQPSVEPSVAPVGDPGAGQAPPQAP